MPLHCPACGARLLAGQINQELHATCNRCSLTLSVAEQLESRLAYYHPKQMEIDQPRNLAVKMLSGGTSKIVISLIAKEAQRILWFMVMIGSLIVSGMCIIISSQTLSVLISLIFGLCLGGIIVGGGLYLLKDYLGELIITANRDHLTTHKILPFGLSFKQQQFATPEIEQLYLTKAPTLPSRQVEMAFYDLWVLLKGGSSVCLVSHRPWLEALYLEQQLEAALGLKDRPVEEELIYLSPVERFQLLEWWPVAESLGLEFVLQSRVGCFSGSYRSFQFRLDAFLQLYGEKVAPFTRLILSEAYSLTYHVRPGDPALLTPPPTSETLKQLLIPSGWEADLYGTLEFQPEDQQLYYEQLGIETDPVYLKFLFDLLSNLVESYSQIMAWGGAAVPALQELAGLTPKYLNSLAIQLLQGIQAETSQRLSQQPYELWCPICLIRQAGRVKVQVGESLLYYYGCWVCGQSRTFFRGQIIAMLDRRMEASQVEEGQILHVNWLHYRRSFDFDAIEIIDATDEDVERLAVQIGNETDPERRARYKTMSCKVTTALPLSENSRRILHRTFEQLQWVEQG